MHFNDRTHAGFILGKELRDKNYSNPLVLALPRGGVPVAASVVNLLHCPMDVFIVRKLGAPGQPEYAIGALTEDKTLWLNDEYIMAYHLDQKYLEDIKKKEWEKIQIQRYQFRDGKPLADLRDKTIIIVDDGIATGATILATLKSLKQYEVKKIVVAVPICSSDAAETIQQAGAELVSPFISDSLRSVGAWYEDFSQVDDKEVIKLLSLNQRLIVPPVQTMEKK